MLWLILISDCPLNSFHSLFTSLMPSFLTDTHPDLSPLTPAYQWPLKKSKQEQDHCHHSNRSYPQKMSVYFFKEVIRDVPNVYFSGQPGPPLLWNSMLMFSFDVNMFVFDLLYALKGPFVKFSKVALLIRTQRHLFMPEKWKTMWQ